MSNSDALRQEILAKVAEYYAAEHAEKPFIPGESRVHYAGRVYDEREMVNMVDSVLDFWLTAGPWAQQFERKLAKFLGVRDVLPVNSGSSANLVAVTSLCSQQIDNPMRPGDEVIVPATSFPTTVNPIIQNGLTPVFVDSNYGDYNLNVAQLEEARSERTRAVMFAHTLGNPADMDAVVEFVRKNDLYLIEDTCDALGSKWDGKMLGTFGQFATLSCYPAHHITMGEGGAVYTNSPKLAKSPAPCAIGDGTAGAVTTARPTANVVGDSTVRFPAFRATTTTNISTAKSATTSKSLIRRRQWVLLNSTSCRTLLLRENVISTISMRG